MRKLILIFTMVATFMALPCFVSAQIKTEKAPDAGAPVQAKENVTPQSAELIEAEELGNRVIKLFGEKKYDEALRLAKRVLEIREKALGTEHVLTDEAVFNVAEIYIAKDKYNEAEFYYRRLLVRYEKIYGPDHIKTAPMIQALGYLAYRREDLAQAETLLLRARAIFDNPLAPRNDKIALLTLELADIYRVKRELIKAEVAYFRARELSELLDEPPSGNTMSIADRASDAYQCFLYETKGIAEAQRMLARYDETHKKPTKVDDISRPREYLNGRALKLPKPPYPTWAMKKGVQGTVLVRVRIDESGNIAHAWAVCGPLDLRDVSVNAARKAQFSPTLLNGKPIVVTGVINYHFGLSR